MSAGWIDPDSRIAGRLAIAWVHAYTRDTAPALAAQRRAELESDIWEQVNETELAGLGAGPILLWRTARGVPADLAWRREAQRGVEGGRPPLHLRWERTGLLGVMLAESVALMALMLATIAHVLHGGGAGGLGAATAGVVAALAAGLLLAATGFGLLTRGRTRWLAPPVLAVAAVIGLLTALPALATISTTIAAIYYNLPLMWTHPGWPEVGALALAVVVIFHGAVTAAWLPSRTRPRGASR